MSDEPADPGTGAPLVAVSEHWCPACNRVVEAPDAATGCPRCGVHLESLEDEDAPPKAPWHFKVLVVGTVGYLIYRLIWFIGWLHHHG